MDELFPTAEQQLAQANNPSDQLGLQDGSFTVRRSNGELETGWTVAEVASVQEPDGSVQDMAVITKPLPEEGREQAKKVPVELLLSWQLTPELVNEETEGGAIRHELGVGAVLNSGLVQEQESGREESRNPRLVRIFSPILSLDEVPAEEPVDYGYLFEKDDVKYEQMLWERSRKSMQREQEKLKHTLVTDESRQASTLRLGSARRADATINNIIGKYEAMNGVDDPEAVVELIRKNADLRYELGSYLLEEKLPRRMHMMPERIAMNTGKTPNHRGYSHLSRLSSREYAVLIALSMIDGTYHSPGKGDDIERGSDGRAIAGQHRAAAEELLV